MPDYTHAYDNLTDKELMAKVRKGWLCDETPCGTGSMVANTGRIQSLLPALCWFANVRSIVDAGAGDLNWIRHINFGDVEYQGFDLYPRHEAVKQADITRQILPKADLILCRHVLNHLSIEMSARALGRFRQSRSKYLLMTMCDNQRDYWDYYSFNPGEPIATFKDCQHWRLELYELT